MSAAALLARLTQRGIRLSLVGDAVRYNAADGRALDDALLAEMRAHKDALRELLRSLRSHSPSEDERPLSRASEGADVPASFAQERLLFLHRLHGPSANYNLTSAFDLEGPLEVERLAGCIAEIVGRHQILRTCFERSGEGYVQRVTDFRPRLVVEDLSGLCPAQRDEAQRSALEREVEQPFDLERGPHLRLRLLRVEAQRHLLVVCMHHIVSDDASIELLVRELRQLYDGAVTLPPLALQYRDVAFDERSAGMASERERALAGWRDVLAGAPPVIGWRTARPRPAVQTATGGTVSRVLDPTLITRLEALRAGQGYTSFHVLLAAYLITLQRYTGEHDLVVGVPVSGRTQREMEPLIGPFLNMLPLRVELDPGQPLSALLERVRSVAGAALEHARVPFEHIVQAVSPPRSPSFPPLFQVIFAHEATPVGIFALRGLTVRTLIVEERTSKYDLALMVRNHAGQSALLLKYNRDLFGMNDAERFADHFQQALRQLIEQPAARLGAVSVLSASEHHQQARVWNDTARDYPYRCALHELFEAQVARAPDRVALETESEQLSYGALNAEANRLARLLVERGVGPESRVAVAAQRSTRLIVAVLAVWKSGAAYLPIDPEYPQARRDFMLRDAGVCLLLADDDSAHEVPRVQLGERAQWAHLAPTNLGPRAQPDHAAYIIYTSGTTGQPKGVITDHRAICNNLLWMNDAWTLGERDVALFKTSIGFDVSVKEIAWPLLAGARMLLARPGGQRDPVYLHETIARHQVSVVHLVPTMLEYFLRDEAAPGARSLRIVMCGGEALSSSLKVRFLRSYRAGLLHMYGPTEAAIAVTGCLLHGEDEREPIALGYAMPNSRLYVVDESLQLAPVGVAGELLIGGVPLARGYLDRPALTAERFVPDPFSGLAGARLYRSGDLVRSREDGQYTYVRRLDRQVKLRGQRIELGEIEAALRAHPAIVEALALVRGQERAEVLAVYAVPVNGVRVAQAELFEHLRQHLPSYMMPSAIGLLPSFPMTTNGKVDVSALPALSEPSSPGLRGTSELERVMLALWREVLGHDAIGRDDSFFEVGGHSLRAVELQEKIAQRFAVTTSVTDVFLYPTVAQLAAHVASLLAPSSARAAALPAQGVERGLERDVAIVGLACRLPGADGVQAFWEGLLSGREEIQHFTPAELEAEGIPLELRSHPRYVPARGAVEGVEQFDAALFGFGEPEAALIDPQIRLLLECAQQALDDAGCDPQRFQAQHGPCAVFAACSRSSYYLNSLQQRPDLLQRFGPLQLAIVTDKSYAATQIAHRFDLRGAALTVDTACSSGLVALHQARRALLDGECAAALVGASSVDVPLRGGYIAEPGNIGSPDGHCRPFEARANGTVKGAGAGVLMLKRAADALRDGDRIYAVIKGSAVNNDGAIKAGFTAPNGHAQAEVIRSALAQAGLSAHDIQYVEAHGTGTSLGDPIELHALQQVFGAQELTLGAVKANIGHLDAAAGIAGLIKAVLMIAHGRFVPQPDFAAPSDALRSSGYAVAREPRSWSGLRRAGVSSFGVGGTNAHVVIEQAPTLEPLPERLGPRIVPLSGSDAEAVYAQAGQLARAVDPDARLHDVASTLTRGRRSLPSRIAIAAADVADLRAQLERVRPQHVARVPALTPKLVFLFAGQGVALSGRLAGVYSQYEPFRARFDPIASVLTTRLGRDPRVLLCHGREPEWALDTSFVQPVLTALAQVLVDCLADFALSPECVLGHSIGELQAACAAGVMPWQSGLELAIERGRLMQVCAPGAMIAVALDEAQARRWLSEGCELAAINAHDQCVLAGPMPDIEALAHKLEAAGVHVRRLPTQRAFHSASMAGAADSFRAEVARHALCEPRIPISSNVYGRSVESELCDPSYWGRQLRSTVRFESQLRELLHDPHAVFVELTPDPQLRGAFLRHPAYRGQPVLSLAERTRGITATSLLKVVGELWAHGVPCDLALPLASEPARVLSLPGVAFRRKRHWVEPRAPGAAPRPAVATPHVPSERAQIGSTAEALLRIMSALVGERAQAMQQDFFEAGGNSLLASQLLAEVERELGVRVSIADFFARPTLEGLAACVDGALSAPREREQLAI